MDREYLDLMPLHRRLLRGDPTASEEIAQHMFRIAVSVLRRKYLLISRDEIVDAVADALLNYYAAPHNYDSSKSNLVSYLIMIAERRLRDHLRKSAQILSHLSFVGSEAEWELISPTLDPFNAGQDELSFEMRWVLDRVFPDMTDRTLVDMVAQGRTDWQEYAFVLGIREGTVSYRRDEVKRARDRIMKRLRRARREFEEVKQ